jgi:hypothetical protein
MKRLGIAAADLAATPYTKAPLSMVAPIYDWSGFYIGANGGWGSAHNCWDVIPFGGVLFNDECINRSGGVIGGQVGTFLVLGHPLFNNALNRISEDIDMVTVRFNYRFDGIPRE